MLLRFYLLIGTLTLFSCNLFAGKVDENVARQVAVNFYRHYAPLTKQQANIMKVKDYKWGERTTFYICSFDKGGFVLVSANDAVTPVLGYGFDHQVPDSITNDAVKEWFDNYARQIDTAFVLNLQQDASVSKWDEILANRFAPATGDSVGPLLTTTWDQGWPYNAFCPVDNNGSGGHCYTGCVATAYGQIMNYHNYPPKGIGNLTYTDLQGHLLSADFDSTYYNWNEMPSSLLPSDTNYQAVAELLYHCGVGSNSQYFQGATTGYYVEEPLLNFFDYAYSSLKYVFRNSFNQTQWDSILTSELNQNRPIYYTASSTSAGHAFVCDGYNNSGYFHFNVGWGGSANGYYLTNNLLFGWDLFNMNQTALIGIKPNDGSNISVDSTFSDYHHFTTSLYFSALSKVKFNPGCTLEFDSGCRLKIGGSVQCTGMPGQPVTFTAYDSISGWEGIKIHSTYHMIILQKEPDTLSFNNTVISYSKNTGIDIQGTGGSSSLNSEIIQEGVLFRNSKIHHNSGLGIYGNFTKLRIDSCQMFNNNGGIELDIGWLDVKNSFLQYNNGTAISYHSQLNFFPDGNSRIINNLICHNAALASGGSPGAISIIPGSYFDPNPVGPVSYITGNIISYNSGNPGGLTLAGNTVVNNNSIYENTSSFYGGGVNLGHGASLINNKIFNNIAGYGGGGVYINYGKGKILNNLIYNNSSGILGSGFCEGIITNNTIVNNGSGISFLGNMGSMKIKNNILWNQGIEINAGTNQVNVSRSIVKGGAANIYATTSLSTIETIVKRDPGFLNPTTFTGHGEMLEGLDWGLNLYSPAIDAAVDDTTGIYLPEFDAYGFQRFNRTLDIGALESQSDTIFPCFIEDGYVFNGCAGNLVHLTVPYRGENCQFEWYHNDSINLGVNNDTLTISSFSEADSGKYFCIVSNPFGKDTSDVIRVNVFSLPPGNPSVIHGHDTIHHFEKELIYWTNNIPNCTKLQWITSSGLSFFTTNDTTINLKVVDTISSGFIKFFGVNPCGTSADTAIITLTVLRMPEILTISGDSSLCAGHSYFYWDNRYTTDFNYQYDRIQWEVPNGLNAYIYFEEGYIAIYNVDSLAQSDTLKARWVKNDYGVGQWSPFPIRIFPVTLDAPESIYGPDSVCWGCNASFKVNYNTDATYYHWFLPTGFEIISGEGTDSITVFADSSALSGIIKVRGYNECDSSLFTVDSIFISSFPQILNLSSDTVLNGQANCYNATTSITVAGNGTTFTVLNGGNATMIAGQNIKFLPTTNVQSGGYLHGYIAPSGPWCQTPSMPAVAMAENEIPRSIVQSSFKIYPNPTTGNFILEVTGESIVDKITVDVYGIWGEKVLSKVLKGDRKHEFSLSDKPSGVYFIRIITGDNAETVKIIKQ